MLIFKHNFRLLQYTGHTARILNREILNLLIQTHLFVGIWKIMADSLSRYEIKLANIF